MSGVGDDQRAAKESVEAIFNALPKSRQMELIGELNEALLYIQRHPHTEKTP